MTKKRKAVDSFEQLARRISREGHLQKNSKGSHYVVLVLTIRVLTEISSCSLVRGGKKWCHAGCSVDATRQGASRELRNLYYENNRRNNGNDTTSNGRNNGVTGKLATNGRPAETF